MQSLILASQSAIRAQLLRQLGIPFQTVVASKDEEIWKQSLAPQPEAQAAGLATAKAQQVHAQYPTAVVIGCDQVCSLAGVIYSKPGTAEAAFTTLMQLQGRTHQLINGISLRGPGIAIDFLQVNHLTMRPLQAVEINAYLRRDQPFGAAGSYMIEQHGMTLFEKIETDDWAGIPGLPLLRLGRELRALGFKHFSERETH